VDNRRGVGGAHKLDVYKSKYLAFRRHPPPSALERPDRMAHNKRPKRKIFCALDLNARYDSDVCEQGGRGVPKSQFLVGCLRWMTPKANYYFLAECYFIFINQLIPTEHL